MEKFAKVCIEVDLMKPLHAGYKLHGKMWRIQYEGIHELCIICGKYGHRSSNCPLANAEIGSNETRHPAQSAKPRTSKCARKGIVIVEEEKKRKPLTRG